jgi:Raf kinase inhibitor-like YbhB/YbcL family protein
VIRLAAALFLVLAACSSEEPPVVPAIPSNLGEFGLTSSAFEEGGAIPEVYTCDGEDISPPLEWTGVPDGTQELMLTLLDPDAPAGVYTHWTMYSIDPSSTGSPEGGIPEGALEGLNDPGETGYTGPCPPEGPAHRYVFTLAALREASALEGGAAPTDVDEALQQKALTTTTLTGVYPG